ncbi:hypothetical protein [Hydrogenophaga electricum]|uniref:Uncharacterized protein n=1 Tax=Hydrogenophaga electricum TaxID=1230953 RepID=A0ABQ6BZF2_9BURK|nr:hypothetical protein [Hydrogenophaga electricum]GLS13528.1 hypothetical protein GCM10007935_09580 [Hydrogenophaga electricum]
MPRIFPIVAPSLGLPLGSVASTAEVARHDTEFARFVERAMSEELGPSAIPLTGKIFPQIVPESEHEAQVWAFWLGHEFEESIDDLAHARMETTTQYSTDLRQRRQILRWTTRTHSFCASTIGLNSSLHRAIGRQVLAVFITPDQVVFSPTDISAGLMDYLMVMDQHCGANYRPEDHYGNEDLVAAAGLRRILGNDPSIDHDQRLVVMLKTRALPKDWND